MNIKATLIHATQVLLEWETGQKYIIAASEAESHIAKLEDQGHEVTGTAPVIPITAAPVTPAPAAPAL